MHEPQKFVFGTSFKKQIADRLLAYIAEKFDDNSAKAAESLGLSRQRLFSYTSAKTLPRPAVFDLFFQKWGLNFLGKGPRGERQALNRRGIQDSLAVQGLLFESPVTLRSEELKVVIRRKGPRLVASIEISTDVKIA